ncbi:hypothetical protein QBC40DRAFT_177447 [Triangularia verruculosa]|uniref:RNase H type-1 domain-containing protein n=1 Tax=Triangularia verruculosa TaxID=2587418 RepID=A0AAN6XES3_9PEZI|nr:hypothetical protein QBC40DRAFT_177447 [Triangularia verruculosa]
MLSQQDSARQGRPGGYGIVWRSDIDDDITSNLPSSKSKGFYVDKAYSVQHMELSGISQSLAKAIQLVSKNKYAPYRIMVFSDSANSLDRIGLGVDPGHSSFYYAHTRPLVKAIIFQSHKLHQLGCSVELNWMPRCATDGHKLADNLAGLWSQPDVDVCQRQKSMDMRDSIADRLHSKIKKEGRTTKNVKLSKSQRRQLRANAMIRQQNAQVLASVHQRASFKATHGGNNNAKRRFR